MKIHPSEIIVILRARIDGYVAVLTSLKKEDREKLPVYSAAILEAAQTLQEVSNGSQQQG